MLLGGTAYFVCILILHFAMPKSEAYAVPLFAMIVPLVVALIPLFAYAVDADVGGRDSAFPTRMLTLPLTTSSLVGWPMFYGSVCIALAWLVVAMFVLRPAGMDLPLYWPAALAAGCMAWFQAMVWRAFALPGLRIIGAAASFSGLVALSSVHWMGRLPEMIVTALLVSTILPAYMVAVAGVKRARCGEQIEWRWPTRLMRRVPDWVSPSLRSSSSPARAQFWFERRTSGLGLPILVGLTLLLLSTWIAINRTNVGLSPNHPLRSPLLLLAAPIVAVAATCSMGGTFGDARRGPQIPAFHATHPMTCAGLIWAKIQVGSLNVAIAWGITIVAFVVMVLLTGSFSELVAQWTGVTHDASTLKSVALATFIVVLLLGGSWRLTIDNMYVGLAGRRGVSTAGMMLMGPAMLAIVPLGHWLWTHPEFHANLLAMIPWVAGLAAVTKLVLGAWLIRAIVRRHLVQARTVRHLLTIWGLAAASLTGLLCFLLPSQLAPAYLVITGVVLGLPLVRISLAPLALAWNRHR